MADYNLGFGWAFPPHFSKDGSADMVSNELEIKQSLEILLSTALGERLFRPDFGCELDSFIFGGASSAVVKRIETMVREAIEKYEKRIYLEEVKVITDELLDGKLNINVSYTILSTDTEDNLSYTYNA